MKKVVRFLAFSLLLLSCGKLTQPSTSTPSATTPKSWYFTSKTDLPTCNATTNGNLAYVSGEKSFYACDGTNWNLVSVVGATGATGATGANGAAGTGSIVIKDGSGNIVAYLIDLNAAGVGGGAQADVFIPSSGISTSIDLATGAYTSGTIYVYYSSTGCTGTVYFGNEYPKNYVVYLGSTGGYFKSSGSSSSNTTSSRLDSSGNCSNRTDTTTGSSASSVSQPYNFSSLAPIVLSTP